MGRGGVLTQSLVEGVADFSPPLRTRASALSRMASFRSAEAVGVVQVSLPPPPDQDNS